MTLNRHACKVVSVTNEEIEIGPRDFDPYRTEISGCFCPMCRELMYSDATGRRALAAGGVLLAALKAGEHVRMEVAEYHAEAKADRDRRIAEAEAAGASAEHLATLRRGYATVKMSDFYATGMGLGIGPR